MKFLCIFGSLLCGFMGLADDWVCWLKVDLVGDGFGFGCASGRIRNFFEGSHQET